MKAVVLRRQFRGSLPAYVGPTRPTPDPGPRRSAGAFGMYPEGDPPWEILSCDEVYTLIRTDVHRHPSGDSTVIMRLFTSDAKTRDVYVFSPNGEADDAETFLEILE